MVNTKYPYRQETKDATSKALQACEDGPLPQNQYASSGQVPSTKKDF